MPVRARGRAREDVGAGSVASKLIQFFDWIVCCVSKRVGVFVTFHFMVQSSQYGHLSVVIPHFSQVQ